MKGRKKEGGRERERERERESELTRVNIKVTRFTLLQNFLL
jgi:hypothetical protein